MKILVLYKINYMNVRNTINEHLYSFKKYSEDVNFYYFNALRSIPRYLSYLKFDGVIIHYTFLSERFKDNKELWKKLINNIKNLNGYKVAIPQDEYEETNLLCDLFKNHNIKTVFTCCFFKKEDYLKAYPEEKTNLDYRIHVLTGYVDENEVISLKKKCIKYEDRPIDIGYRARRLPYYLGKHGQLKYELAEFFLSKLKNSDYRIDISNDYGEIKEVFYSKEWYKFLLRCKSFLGCEGGASLLDPDGKIKRKVRKYIRKYPDADFAEVEKSCLLGKDYNICSFLISPRHFEAIITKTLQVLVEGEYEGILKSGLHYIELKKDFSNIDKVLELLKDDDYCQKIIGQAYNDIILSGKYTYRKFVNLVLNHIRNNKNYQKIYILDKILFFIFGIYIPIRNFFIGIVIKIFYLLIIKLLKNKKIYNKIKNYKLLSIIRKFIPFN